MDSSATSQTTAAPAANARETIAHLTNALMIALLEGIKDDIKAGALPSRHLAEYEALCRAESTRLG